MIGNVSEEETRSRQENINRLTDLLEYHQRESCFYGVGCWRTLQMFYCKQGKKFSILSNDNRPF